MSDDRYHTAIHEAGHAVIGRILDLYSGHVTILADDDSAGHCIIAAPEAIDYQWERRGHFRLYESIFRARPIAYMAGGEAEEIIIGNCHGGDGDDRYQIARMLDEVTDEANFERTEARLRKWTRVLVRRHRARIEQVAGMLLESGRLEGPEIDELIGNPIHREPEVDYWDMAV